MGSCTRRTTEHRKRTDRANNNVRSARKGYTKREQEWGTLRLSHDSAQVWTERMLAALERGNDARQWHTLIAKVFSPKTLALAEVQKWMAEAGLTLHPEKTRVVDATRKGGFEFLGWHFERGYKWPRRKSIQKLKDSVRAHTKRNGRGRGRDHNRYPNAWFALAGVGLPDFDHPRFSRESHEVKGASRTCGHSSTGEPDAGNPPVRF